MTETETPEGLLQHFDLSKLEDVDRLATMLGKQWCQTLAQIAASIPESHLGHFWTYAIGPGVGAMSRSIGMENTDAVIQALLRTARALSEQRDAGRLAAAEPANKLPA